MIRARSLLLVLALAGCKMGEDALVRDVLTDNPKILITVEATSAEEGETLTFTASLNRVSSETVSVDWATTDGSATSGDYVAATGTLTFAPGETSKTFTVDTVEDTFAEYDEIVRIAFSGGANYDATTQLAAGEILNDDTAPAVIISDASATEGNAITFTVTLTSDEDAVTIDYATSDGTATTADSDYTNTSGTISFAVGETSKTVTVNTTSDGHYEAIETITVTLSGGSGYSIPGSDLTATGTINNDDSPPTISINDDTENEGTALGFTVTLSHRSYQTITVDYATSDDTATTADSDYSSTSGTLTFAPEDLSESFTVATTADTKYEGNDALDVTLSGGSNYTAAGSDLIAVGTITNDDAVPQISIDDVSAQEGGNLVFTVTQDRQSAFTTTFDYASSSGTATSGSDFTATSGSGSITAGNTTTTISVPLTEDTAEESDETFTMTLSNEANATISDAGGTGTVVDTVLLLNFMTGSLPTGTALTRASTANYVNAAGNIVSAAINTARFDYDPATLSLRGLLIEPAATNLVLQSAAFDNGAWTKSNLRPVTNNGGDSASPDGVNTNAELVRESNSLGEHSISQVIGTPVATGSLVQFSLYVKNGATARNYFRVTIGDSTTTDFIRADFDVTETNAPSTASGGTGGGQLTASIRNAGNGWKRIHLGGVVSTVFTALTVTIHLQNSFGGNPLYLGDNASGLNFWGAQLEVGSTVPTSYIATGGATATRSADVLQVTSFTGFSGGFGDGTNWTMITDFSRPRYENTATSASPRIAEFCDSADCVGDRISSRYSATAQTFGTESMINAANQGDSLTGAIVAGANTVYQLGAVKTAGVVQTFMNGTAYTASASIAYPTVDRLYLGTSGYTGSELTGHLRKFTLRARALPSAQMLTFTND